MPNSKDFWKRFDEFQVKYHGGVLNENAAKIKAEFTVEDAKRFIDSELNPPGVTLWSKPIRPEWPAPTKPMPNQATQQAVDILTLCAIYVQIAPPEAAARTDLKGLLELLKQPKSTEQFKTLLNDVAHYLQKADEGWLRKADEMRCQLTSGKTPLLAPEPEKPVRRGISFEDV